MELTYDLIFNFVILPPGRGLWMSGTEYAKTKGDALVNCWFISNRPQSYITGKAKKVSMPFVFLFDQCMKGGGVGFSVQNSNVNKIPKVKNYVNLTIVCNPLKNKDFDKMAHLVVTKIPEKYDVFYEIEDSRQGWCESLKYVIDEHWNPKKKFVNLVLDISDVRAQGEPIKGFGGTSSGGKPLVELLQYVNNLINSRITGKLSPIDCVDINNFIGRTVVAGNVRRSSEIALADPDNIDFINMKNWRVLEKLYTDKNLSDEDIANLELMKELQLSHRWASNNSIIIDNKYDEFEHIVNGINSNGEPGIFNIFMAQNFGRVIDGYNPNSDPDVEGQNPCGEITLENGGCCNLVEVFPLICDQLNIPYNIALDIAVKYTKRVTFARYEWEVSREIVSNTRRIGVSLSGLQDWLLKKFGNIIEGWEIDKYNFRWAIFKKEVVDTLDNMYNIVVKSDKAFSNLLECTESIKKTTIKPSGSISLLPGLSPGIHFHYSSWYIRRIRFNQYDSLLDVLKKCGFKMESDLNSPNTTVVEFPIEVPFAESNYFKSCQDITIEEQFAIQSLLQSYWADNSVSCTITFKEEEKNKINDLLKQYRYMIKSTSLLPYSGHGYKQAPYEPITKEEYERRIKEIKFRPEDIMKVDNSKEIELKDYSECAGGSCPIR